MTGPPPCPAVPPDAGLLVIRRLHRMVRHGYRPWLGYDVASGGDGTVHLRRRDGTATLHPDGSVTFEAPGQARTIGPGEADAFDTAFPPDAPNRRNLVRRLYEIGLGGS